MLSFEFYSSKHLYNAAIKINLRLFFRGFSTIDLVQNDRTRRKFALKRITCHSIEDQIQVITIH